MEITMTTRQLVDLELVAALDTFPAISLTTESLPQTRASFKEMMNTQLSVPHPEFSMISVSERHILGPQDAPDVRVLVYLPAHVHQALPALLWMHGGGYVLGTANQEELLIKSIISSVGCAVISVDYRLAPETPHPGPVEDCYAALKWVYTHTDELGVDTTRIAIGGASAGAGLTAGLALLMRDRGEVPLVFQLLIYPMLDDRTVTATMPNPYTGEFMWTADTNRFGWTAYLGQKPGGSDVSPYAAAARADHLEGLPPTFIGVGSLDLFVDEDIEYAHRLLRAGVPTELRVYPGAFHTFDMVVEGAQVTQSLIRDKMNALKRAFS